MSFDLKGLFGVEKPVVAMAHLPPMPGTPLYDETAGPDAIVESVRRDVEILARCIAEAEATRSGFHIYELPLSSWRAVPGSKVRVWHGVRAMWDLAWIARDRSRRRSTIA